MAKTFKLTCTEAELMALIDFHKQSTSYDIETSSRIHDLTKRLNRDMPEIEMIEQAKTQEPISQW